MRPNSLVFVGLGSNLGDRSQNIVTALDLIAERTLPVAASPLYETEPVGFVDQPRFLNAVCAIDTSLGPRELLEFLASIERSLDRKPAKRWRPRTIDLDILAMGSATVCEDGLRIPHPRVTERLFVCQPFADLAPDFVLPGQNSTMASLRDSLKGGPAVDEWRPAEELIESLRCTAWSTGPLQVGRSGTQPTSPAPRTHHLD
ncbi:MAG: 2-amino-4-hydroxy-6-hydroxymethyldihydropteridine diphosphokinase [Chloroflexi bacterium]|nr:2-amino-4-hydroxy-6-hydroxymethyldihydropteridine diphosphokinase [Chloroflexota bacterium]